MLFHVVKPFRDVDGKWKAIGQTVELGPDRASKLRRYGMIGGQVVPEKAIAPPPERPADPEVEKAVAPGPEETAEKKPRGRRRRIVTEE
jgi:hypothetical protein